MNHNNDNDSPNRSEKKKARGITTNTELKINPQSLKTSVQTYNDEIDDDTIDFLR
jgi:hypothetical protein